MSVEPKMEAGWKRQLQSEFASERFAKLKEFLLAEKASGQVMYPPGSRIFAAFDLTPWDKVKVVILGQDPYHGPGQANGLCFSVAPGVPFPPSLRNIFKEMEDDLGLPPPEDGDLSAWAQQGVLLLNATLTVRAHQAASHQKQGWEEFTDVAVRALSDQKENLVFILWGSSARKKGAVIDRSKHVVIESPHPSPLSAHRGFFGSKPFSQVNQALVERGIEPIDWQLAGKA